MNTTGHPIEELLGIMARLRAPESGCPWDIEQNFASLVSHTLEEAYEVVETIDRSDFTALCDELGDLLFHVVFYARLAEERKLFDFDKVVAGIVDKLVRRHPHVFGTDHVRKNHEELSRSWERQKTKERAARGESTSSLMDGVNHGVPSLARAMKLQKRAATVGFDWEDSNGVFNKLLEESEEFHQAQVEGDPARIMEEMGDLLFTCVNLARHHRIDPETALRHANTRFEHRFRRMETLATEQSTTLPALVLDQMNVLWEEAKASTSDLSSSPQIDQIIPPHHGGQGLPRDDPEN